jgi:2'-5' RNA ligase
MSDGLNTDPTGRLFIAVTLPFNVIASLTAAREEFQAPGLPRLRWVDNSRMHLTLQFLGETRLSQAPLIEEAMQAASSGMPSLRLTVAGWGLFSSKLRRARTAAQSSGQEQMPRVLWAGLAGDVGELIGCADRLGAALASHGIASDRKLFRPHITLARVPHRASPAECDMLREAVERIATPSAVEFQVAEIHLIHSLLGKSPQYRILRSVEFRPA